MVFILCLQAFYVWNHWVIFVPPYSYTHLNESDSEIHYLHIHSILAHLSNLYLRSLNVN